MEKIIELLNEAIRNWLDFQWNDILKIGYYSETDIRAYYDKTARAYYNITYEDIISKRAGFIEWLVRENKIDTNKLEKIWYEKTVCRYDWQYIEIVEYSKYESLLMILSIQDKPIEFLISVIK
jgi:hypothetical protein